MKQQSGKQLIAGSLCELETQVADLDLVIPFTTPELTRAAIRAAERLGPGLHAAIRLIRLQLVPHATEMSPVHLGFLKEQLEAIHSELPIHPFVLFTRNEEAGLEQLLHSESIVILASKRRPWRTRTEWTARRLRDAGHRVILIHTDPQLEAKNA